MNFFFKTFLYFDFKPDSDEWVFDKNQFTNPVVCFKLQYYDEKTDTIDKVTLRINHLDGNIYELSYKAIDDIQFHGKKVGVWFNGIKSEDLLKKGFVKI